MDYGADSYNDFLKGDTNGLVQIIELYKDGLVAYLNSIVQDIHAAEELTEEVFVKLVVKKPHFTGRSSFKTWLYTVARNTAVDYLRSCTRTKEYTVEDISAMAADEEELERAYIRTEQRILVHKSLGKIKPEYRQVLYLTFYEEFDNTQAAKIMKRSKRQIENLVYRAKQALKVQLIQEGGSYEEF